MFFFDLISKFIYHLFTFAGYITGNSAFPPALTISEENKYLQMLNEGDKNARKILIERNLRLVAHIAKKYSDDNNLNDYISIGTIGLIKGIDSYDIHSKKRLSPYISRCIENEILMTLRKNKKRQNEVSIDDTIGVDKEGNSLTLADILPAEQVDISDEIWTKTETKKLMNILSSALTETEYIIISKRYGINGMPRMTQREIAKQLNISRSYVSRIEKKCLNKLSHMLNNSQNQ